MASRFGNPPRWWPRRRRPLHGMGPLPTPVYSLHDAQHAHLGNGSGLGGANPAISNPPGARIPPARLGTARPGLPLDYWGSVHGG